MRLVPLGSGSSGNATFVELGRARLLVDAGLSARALTQRLEAIGVDPASIDLIVLSHEHEDHTRGAELFSKRHGVAASCSYETLEAMDRSPVHFARWEPFDGPFEVGDATVDPFPVPHDAARPVGFLLRGEGLRVAVVNDLGHATTLVLERLRGCHVVALEANHDDALLMNGSYPWHLKQRVSGRLGHLSNHEAAAVLERVVSDACQAVVLTHLSEKNNTAALARQICARALTRAGAQRVAMRVAAPRRPTPAIEL